MVRVYLVHLAVSICTLPNRFTRRVISRGVQDKSGLHKYVAPTIKRATIATIHEDEEIFRIQDILGGMTEGRKAIRNYENRLWGKTNPTQNEK